MTTSGPTTSTAAGGAPRRRRLPRGEGGQLREDLLDATEKLLFDEGEDAVTIRAVAGAVGVTAPTLYRHFEDRDDLLFSVCARRFAHLAEHLRAAVVGAADEHDELRRRGAAYIRFGLANPPAYQLLFMEGPEALQWEKSESFPADGDDPGAAAFGDLLDNIERAQARGLLRSGDPYLLACTLFAMLHGVTSGLIGMPSFPWPDPEELIDGVLDVISDGIASR